MKQKIKTGAVTFIAIMLLIIAPVVTMDTTYASDTLTTNTTSKDVKQSKNIQNKTDINIKKQTIISKLLSLGSEYTLKTNLEDDFTMRSSKKTFDVWARKGGLKMPAFATLFRLNSAGKEKYIGEINVAWDDGNKSSFTLDMSNQAKGDFVIKVWTGGDSIESASVVKAYHFTYEKTPKGGYIGDIVIDIEAFTISLGYVEEPERLPIYEGDNSATVIDRYLKSKGYTYDSTGSIESGFYLGRIRGLTSIDLSTAKLEQTVATVVDEDEWNKDDYEEGSLGEKDFTANSGWMYSVNNVFPNVGFSEFYFEPEDVVRIQFTVATGREIGGSGGSSGTGSDYYSVADKDELTALLANINSSINCTQIKDDQEAASKIARAIDVCKTIAIKQGNVDEITDEINDYLGKNSESPTIELNAAEVSLKKGNTQKVEATVGDINTLSPLLLRWTSDEPEIATVDSFGNITAQSSGTTIITVTIGSSNASCSVTVEEVPLEDIKLVPVTLWSGGADPYLEYKTDNGYRFPTNVYPEFMIEPVPSDTTDDLTPQYTLDTKKYMDLTVIQDQINRCSLIGKHEGTSMLTARVGEYSAQLEIEFYENKVTSFTCDDPEPALSINGYGAVTRKVLTFTTDPDKAQDRSSVYFTSSDPSVFIVNEPLQIEGSGSVIKKTIYARGEGVADLYVTIGNITRTYPVTVYDLKESDEIVPNGYDTFSQVYLSSDTNKAIDWIGGYRYRAGKKYNGTNDATQFAISLEDPSQVLSFSGVTYTSHEFVCSGSFQDIYARTYIWPLPTFTGATGTAVFTNKMFGKECMMTKITVADEVIPVESVQITDGDNNIGDEGTYSINDTMNLQCAVSPENATGEVVWYSSDQDVATVNQSGHVRLTGYGDTDIVACIAGKYAVHTIHVDQPMTGMTISNEELNLTSGISRKLMAWCVPNDTTDDHTITWESSDSEVVSVDSNGKITTHKVGEATITASTENHNVTCHVIVDDQKLRQIYFPKSPIYIEVGETINVGAPKTVPESAHAETSDYTWSSSDESYATVDQEGNVTLHKASPVDRAGTLITNEEYYNNRVKVYAEKDGVRGTCVIQTGSPMTGLDMSSREVTIYKGDEIELEALFLPEDTTENRGGITWKSSNGLIVSQRAMEGNFNEFKRLIVGLKLGEATITATCGEFTASCRVKVILPPNQQAAYDLQKKIEGWTDLDPVTDRADYVRIGLEIQETWETFNNAQKKLVGGYNEYFAEHLDEIREMAASDQRVADVVSLIDSIGEVTLDDACKAKINAARKAFDALTDEQKKKFDLEKLQVLIEAELRIKALQEKADKQAEIRKKKAAAKKLKVKGLKVKVKSRKFTLTWKKTKGASGYQIQYRKKGAKKFSSLKTTRLKVRTKKLKKNKKYQFRVRTIVKIEGKPVYGKWTRIKTVKCK